MVMGRLRCSKGSSRYLVNYNVKGELSGGHFGYI